MRPVRLHRQSLLSFLLAKVHMHINESILQNELINHCFCFTLVGFS